MGKIRRVGFGAMHLETAAGAGRQSALAVVRRAVELGVGLIDTAYLYGGGANEELLAEALHPYPEGLLVTTKVGVAQSGPAGEWRLDGRPAVLRTQVEQALKRLRMERIELLQLHRVDPEVPLDDQVGTRRSSGRSPAPPGSTIWRRTSPPSTSTSTKPSAPSWTGCTERLERG